MKGLLFRTFILFACSCTFISCNDTEDVNADIDNLINDYIYRTVEITIDGEKAELPGWAMAIMKEDQSVYGIAFNDYDIAGEHPSFRVSANLSGNDVVFSGDYLLNTPEYQMQVEGRLVQKDSATDIWYLDIKRTVSDETPLTGITFLIELDANSVDLDKFEDQAPIEKDGEKMVLTDYIRQYPLSVYFNCLREVLGCKTLKLSFGEDNQITIEGKDEQTGQFIPFEGKHQYFLTDENEGYIDMNLDSDIANLFKEVGNREVIREEWRNSAYIPFELKASAEGKILLSLDPHNISHRLHSYYLIHNKISEEEYNQYNPYSKYWWKDIRYDDKLWIKPIKLD